MSCAVRFGHLLANCGFGPNMMVNDLLYEKVTPEVLEEVIAKYQTA